jgi:uncharacterized membrane protein
MKNRTHRPQMAFWLIPLIYSMVALAAGMTIPRIEAYLLGGYFSPMSTGSAIAIYSAIASGMIALTGIVFSLTFVIVQFSATAYSPRLALWVSRDPVIAHSLGIFTATFLYAVAALSGVDRAGSGKVPFASVILVLLLLVGSVVMFVALIQRIGLLHISRMLIFTGDQGRKVIDTLYPEKLMDKSGNPQVSHEIQTRPPTQTLIHHGSPRSLESIDVGLLIDLAQESDGIIEVKVVAGDTVVEMRPLLRVLGSRQPLDEWKLRKGMRLGEERTFEQDPKYAIRLLVDIAIRALSPAINDPTTAVQALDQLEDILLRLGLRRLDVGEYRDREGNLRVIVRFPVWEDFLLLAFEEICAYGSGSVQVMRRMKAVVSDLSSTLPEERHASLKYWMERIDGTIERSFAGPEEKMDASVEDRQGLGTPRHNSAGR